jgi:outer membrane receptor for ferrienterochelin and colicins
MIRINKHLLILIKLLIVNLLFAPGFSKQATAADSVQSSLFEVPIEELMDVNVTTASKKSESIYEAPSVMNVVSKEEIEIYGDRNLFQLLQRQPSIFTQHSYAFGDNLASFRGDLSTHQERHTLLLLNGRPIRESALGYDFPVYMAFPLTTLSSVEIVRGPGSVLYGTNAFTGVINLKTEVPDHNESSIFGMGGSHGYYQSDATTAGKSGELDYVAAARVSGQRGYHYRLIDGSGTYGEDRNHENTASGLAHIGLGNLKFDIFAADIDMFNMGEMIDWRVPHDSCTKRLFTNLGYTIPLGENTSLELNGTYNLQEDHHAVMVETPPEIGTNSSDFLAEATLYTKPLENMNVVLGFLQQYLTNYHPDDEYFQSIKPYRYEPKSAYAQADYKINSLIKLVAGTQWNESPLGDSDTVIRYGMILTPHENWGVKLLRGEAFRGAVGVETDLYHPTDPASFYNLFIGNKDVEPEEITTYDAQLFFHDEKTYAAVTYFHSKTKGMIIYDGSAPPVMTVKNGGDQTFDGIEFEGKRFITSNWHVLSSFMYQNNKQDDDLFPVSSPDKMFKLGTGYVWDQGDASIFYTYFGKEQEIEASAFSPSYNPEPDSMDLISININLDVSKWIGLKKGQSTLTLRVENLLDEDLWTRIYAANSFIYGPGRTYYAGLRIKF